MVAYQTGKTLYVSGHIPMTPEGKLLTGTVREREIERDTEQRESEMPDATLALMGHTHTRTPTQHSLNEATYFLRL